MAAAVVVSPSALLGGFLSLIFAFLAGLTSSERGCETNIPPSCNVTDSVSYITYAPKFVCPAFTAVYNENGDISINCKTSNPSVYAELNNMCFDDLRDFTFHHCPLPAISLSQTMRNMGASEIHRLELESEFAKNVTREFFRGLPDLTSLILRSSGTAQLPYDVFTDMTKLLFIILEYDNIVLPMGIFRTVPKLETIMLISDNMTILEAGVFFNLSNLKTLELEGNILNLSSAVLSGIQGLNSLMISSNKMTEIPRDLFLDLTDLRHITFTKNAIKNLPENLLNNNRNLTYFYLLGNKQTITTLPSKLLSNFTELRFVHITSCDMSFLPDDLLWESKSIEGISLTKNLFTTFPELLFKDCEELEDLDLSFNRITHLSSRLFSNARKLETLKLNNNLLTVITGDTFIYQERLETISLNNNLLTFEEETLSPLYNCNNLHKIYIANNSLTKIFTDWRKLKSLQRLDLTFNKISRIQAADLQFHGRGRTNVDIGYNNISEIDAFDINGIFKYTFETKKLYVPQKHIFIKGNPVNCNCKYYSFQMYDGDQITANIKIVNENNSGHLQCVQPEAHGENIDGNIPINLFSCLFKKDYFMNCPKECNYTFRHSDSALLVDCYQRNITSMPEALPDLGLSSHTELNLSGNRIKSIKSPLGRGYYKVTKFMLSDNVISEVDLSAFPPHTQATDLPFDDTKITDVDIRYNNISQIDMFDVVGIYKYSFQTEKSKIPAKYFYTKGNPINCSCQNYTFIQYDGDQVIANITIINESNSGNLQCVQPEAHAKNIDGNISIKHFSCLFKKDYFINCPKECNYTFRPSDSALIVDCYQRNITSIPEALPDLGLSNHTELNISGNRIKSVMSPLGRGYYKVTKFLLSDNVINEIDLSAFSPRLQVLHIDGNNLRQFVGSFTDFLNHTRNLTQLTLDKNPWQCDCTTMDFVLTLQSIYTSQIKLLGNTTCENGRPMLNMTYRELCPEETISVDGISFTVAILEFLLLLISTLGILCAVYFRFKREIQVWLYAHRCCLRFVTEEELDKHKVYDAFISYSHHDDDFVDNHLVPGLEDGPHRYKLCLHYRNWLAGEYIPAQIARSVEESRRTVIVLSSGFLKSEWGKMEFRTAHCEALRERRVRVIVILYGEIGPTEKLDPDLRAYLSTNTYLKWGDPWFWDKLYYALPCRPTSGTDIEIPLKE